MRRKAMLMIGTCLCLSLGACAGTTDSEQPDYALSPLERSVRLQLESGAGGGNPCRVDMSGKRSIYVKLLAAEPLTRTTTPNMSITSRAYASALRIPDGGVLVIHSVRYRGGAAGDSNGHGEFIVAIAGKEICHERNNHGPFGGHWDGDARVASGEESSVYVEVANSSWADVEIEGELRPK